MMKLAVISTTIRGDTGYRDYDEMAARSPFSEVRFIVAGDVISPSFNSDGFKCHIEYLSADDQKQYNCSETIGWRKFARRNTALLKAMEWQPDYILTVDDDNRPDKTYFQRWYDTITTEVTWEARGQGECEWHNYLETGDTHILMYPRGYPIIYRGCENTSLYKCSPISPSQIGIYQGLSMGDPDIDAITRIVHPEAEPLHDVCDRNYCLRHIWSPYNTQNTLWSKCLFPLAFTWPHADRFEDIYGSLSWQQYLFNNDMYGHIGEAINYQVRGNRNNLRDLSLEVEGYLHVHEVWERIKQINSTDVIDFIRSMALVTDNDIIAREKEFLETYLKDLIKIGY